MGAARSPPENNRSPCTGVIPRSRHARLQKLTELSYGWKLHLSSQHKQHQDQGHTESTNITKTNDLNDIPLSCPSSENVTKYFFYCFLNFVRPPNPLNFFTCFCKSLFELFFFSCWQYKHFRYSYRQMSLLKSAHFPNCLTSWKIDIPQIFLQISLLIALFEHPSVIAFLSVRHKKKQGTLVSPTFL